MSERVEITALCQRLAVAQDPDITFWGTQIVKTLPEQPNMSRIIELKPYSLDHLARKLSQFSEACANNKNLSLSQRVECLDALNNLLAFYRRSDEKKKHLLAITRFFLWMKENTLRKDDYKENVSRNFRTFSREEYRKEFGISLSEEFGWIFAYLIVTILTFGLAAGAERTYVVEETKLRKRIQPSWFSKIF